MTVGGLLPAVEEEEGDALGETSSSVQGVSKFYSVPSSSP